MMGKGLQTFVLLHKVQRQSQLRRIPMENAVLTDNFCKFISVINTKVGIKIKDIKTGYFVDKSISKLITWSISMND